MVSLIASGFLKPSTLELWEANLVTPFWALGSPGSTEESKAPTLSSLEGIAAEPWLRILASDRGVDAVGPGWKPDFCC